MCQLRTGHDTTESNTPASSGSITPTNYSSSTFAPQVTGSGVASGTTNGHTGQPKTTVVTVNVSNCGESNRAQVTAIPRRTSSELLAEIASRSSGKTYFC